MLKSADNANQPLDGRQLRAFVSLARTGSLTRTAKELFLTHSAISHSMKALENDVGCRLLTTVGKRIVLTEAGEAFQAQAEDLIGRMRDARAALQALNHWGHRELQLLAEPAFFDSFLADALAAIRKENPHLFLRISFDHAPQTHRSGDHRAVIVCLEPERITGAEFTPLLSDHLQFVIHPSHPWAASPELARSTVNQEPYVTFPRTVPLRRMVDDYFAEANIDLNVVAEVESIGAIKALVRRKFGMAILPLWSIKRELAEGRLATVPLGRRRLTARWGVLHRAAHLLKNVERQFITACVAKIKPGMGKGSPARPG